MDALKLFPKLAALDTATRTLFDGIVERDEGKVLRALTDGARLDQPEPYHAGKAAHSDVEGGLLPLQRACCCLPQRPLHLGVLSILLEHGADPNAIGIGDKADTPLGMLCQRLPQNGPAAIELLSQHGAQVNIEMIEQALTAHQAWSSHKGPVQYLQGTLDALWNHMPEKEQSKLSVEMLMKAVPNDATALDYEQIKRVQWLANHCQVNIKPDMASRLAERRENTSAPPRPGMKLH